MIFTTRQFKENGFHGIKKKGKWRENNWGSNLVRLTHWASWINSPHDWLAKKERFSFQWKKKRARKKNLLPCSSPVSFSPNFRSFSISALAWSRLSRRSFLLARADVSIVSVEAKSLEVKRDLVEVGQCTQNKVCLPVLFVPVDITEPMFVDIFTVLVVRRSFSTAEFFSVKDHFRIYF